MNYEQLVTTSITEMETEEGETLKGWVCVTGWSTQFGKQWNNYWRSPDTKEFIVALEERIQFECIVVEGSGRASKTFMHPQLAIHYMMWLSPEFAEWGTRILKRYIEGDITLADEIVECNIEQTGSTKDAEWLSRRIEGKVARKALTDTLKERGGTNATFQKVSADTNKFVIGMSAKEIQRTRGVKSTRDGLTAQELIKVAFTELVSAERIEETNARGHKELSYQHNRTCRDVAALLDN
jgi:hypothetical protein